MESVKVRCNLCGADDYEIVYNSNVSGTSPTVEECVSTVNKYGSFNRIVLCRSCGLVYVNPRDAGLMALYEQVTDNEYVESWEDRAKTFRRQLKVLEKYSTGKGRLLDIGCYAGVFLKESEEVGYDVTGIEPSRWAADIARDRSGAKVINSCWEKASLSDNSFDIITLWDVIEHLEDPSACLKQVHRWLKKGGIVAITTHDIGSMFARLMGKRYPWLMRFHLYHFTPKILSLMLSKNRLETVFTQYYTKRFSLKYILGRLNLRLKHKVFERVTMPLFSGDMFMIIGKKIYE